MPVKHKRPCAGYYRVFNVDIQDSERVEKRAREIVEGLQPMMPTAIQIQTRPPGSGWLPIGNFDKCVPLVDFGKAQRLGNCPKPEMQTPIPDQLLTEADRIRMVAAMQDKRWEMVTENEGRSGNCKTFEFSDVQEKWAFLEKIIPDAKFSHSDMEFSVSGNKVKVTLLYEDINQLTTAYMRFSNLVDEKAATLPSYVTKKRAAVKSEADEFSLPMENLMIQDRAPASTSDVDDIFSENDEVNEDVVDLYNSCESLNILDASVLDVENEVTTTCIKVPSCDAKSIQELSTNIENLAVDEKPSMSFKNIMPLVEKKEIQQCFNTPDVDLCESTAVLPISSGHSTHCETQEEALALPMLNESLAADDSDGMDWVLV